MDKNANWESILKWSLAQSDGTGPTRQISEEERRWFNEAVMANQVDVVKRMKEISTVLRLPENDLTGNGVTVEELEGLLEELQEHVESIDMANDLHVIGGLTPLLAYLSSSHASLRARAAETVMTMVQNNPKCQAQVMEAGGLTLLVNNFETDEDVTVRAKSIGAISSLIRNNSVGLDAFRLGSGLKLLKNSLSSTKNSRLLRKSLTLLQYLIEENPTDAAAAIEFGVAPALTQHLGSEDPDVRSGVLNVLIAIAKAGKRESEAIFAGSGAVDFKSLLVEKVSGFQGLEGEEQEAVFEERVLMERLLQMTFPGSIPSLVTQGTKPGQDETQGQSSEPPKAPLLLQL